MSLLIQTKRTRLRYLFDLTLTALGWIAFAYLFGEGILALLVGDVRGPDAPLLPAEFLSSVRTVLSYGLLMVIGTAFLIVWAKYNQFRFVGKDRRKRAPALSGEQLMTSLGVTNVQFDDAQGARVMTVHQNENGAIVAVDVVDLAALAQRRPAAAAQAAPGLAAPAVRAAVAESVTAAVTATETATEAARPVTPAPVAAPPSVAVQARRASPAKRRSRPLAARFGRAMSAA